MSFRLRATNEFWSNFNDAVGDGVVEFRRFLYSRAELRDKLP